MSPLTLVAVSALIMALIEWRRPRQRLPRRAHWWLRAALLNLVQIGIAYGGAHSWDAWFAHCRLIDLSSAATGLQALCGYVLITFVFYWWHRARHQIPLLWRQLHQLHHSPARLQIATSFYKHPLEMFLNAGLCSAIMLLVLGLSPSAIALTVSLTGVAELYYHWNVKTPYWSGFLFQRPESHCVHHQRGSHNCNYSDLPLWDLLFGTFHNPRHSPIQLGFSAAAEYNLPALLLGRPTPRSEQ